MDGSPISASRPLQQRTVRYRAGISWRDLPAHLGDFRVVHRRHARWSKTGTWMRVFEALAQDAGNEYAMIDATIVRAHQHSASAKRAQPRRAEHHDPRHGRCPGQSNGLSPYPWTGTRS